ncbi:site-specific DNA-methyltransferase [Gammaproteobacteria bacterium]|nr:site-specific DNA-methyltransferase [Gammaproteobacteria bacterium]
MDKLKMHTPDITQQNIDKLLALFPNCKTEKQDANGELSTGVDFDLLKQELSKNIVEGPQERYQLNWPGKKEALLTANAPVAKTLRPCREESVDFDTTGNLFIEGDNLDALKLLQETYLGKVKMIYIDPPYNTGHDFIYADNFAESTDEYLRGSGQKDEEGNRLVANMDSNGRFHSDWLSMMYSRIKLARNLLKDDGVIFVSIDENEVHNLKKLCDDVFGGDNFVTTFCWEKKKKPSFLNKNLGAKFEFVLAYAKSRSKTGAFSVELTTEGKKYPFNNAGNSASVLNFPPGSIKFNMIDQVVAPQDMSEGKIKTRLLSKFTIKNGVNTEVVSLEGEWRYSQNKLDEIVENKEEIIISKIPFRPNHVKEGGEIKKMHNLLTIAHYSIETNEDADSEQSQLLGNSFFDYAKPSGLIKLLAKSITYERKNDIILDFFAGSSTTAHAVMGLNAEDSGRRKFIMVQLPEVCDEKSEAFKVGYESIAEISKERIRRAGTKIKEENPQSTSLDTGFRVLKIDSSNMNEVHYRPDLVAKGDLLDQIDHIKTDRSSEDLLYQVMLDWGVDLSLPIRKETIEGKEVYFVNDDDLVACFDKGIDEALIKALAAEKPLRVVFRDDGFVSDSVKINVEQIFKQLAPATDIKAI